MKKYIVAAALAVASLASSAATGWQAEQKIIQTNMQSLQTQPKAACAYSTGSKELVCAFTEAVDTTSQRVNLFEVVSKDGGATWGPRKQITSNLGDEYDPFMEYDTIRNRFQLTYSKWHNDTGGAGNDVVVSYRVNGNWVKADGSAGYDLVAGAGKDYWVNSSLLLKNGTQLIFSTRGGPEDKDPAEKGYIYSMKSTNGGISWGAPIKVSAKCGSEYARGVENRNGHVMVVFSKYSDSTYINKVYGSAANYPCKDGLNGAYVKSSLHTVWSEDSGNSWIPASESEAFISPAGFSYQHPYIQKETTNRQQDDGQWTLMYTVNNTSGGYNVVKRSSQDQGLTWGDEAIFTATNAASFFNIDPIHVNTCRGFAMVTNSTNSTGGIYMRRYDWNDGSPCAN